MAKRVKKVFFAWEKRSGMLGFFGRARIRQILIVAAVLTVTAWLFAREGERGKTRATRATIGVMFRAVSAYRADHHGNCPKDLSELKAGGYSKEMPIDAWGRPLHLVCPSVTDKAGFQLVSDGPSADEFSRVE